MSKQGAAYERETLPSVEFQANGRAMSARVRAHDWAVTPLGPIAAWPASLSYAVQLALDSPLPSAIIWGPELTFIHNDAYRSILGDKPDALGRPVLDIWSEVADALEPMLRRALAGGVSTQRNAPFTLQRRGAPEEAWFDYSFSPVRDETGAAAGVLHPAIETTARVLADRAREDSERRLRETADAAGLSSDFRALFESAPTPMIALAPPDWTVVAANDARLKVTGMTRGEQVGRRLFDLFPNDPNDPAADGVEKLRASLDRVLATRAADAMAIQRYAIQRANGRFEERWWSPLNTPVLGAEGEVALVIHRVEDVTEIVRMRGKAEAADQLARDQQAVIDRLHSSEDAQRTTETRYRQIVEGAEDFAIVTLDPHGLITGWNSGAEQITGFARDEAVGSPGAIFFTPEDREAGAPDREMNRAASDGRAVDERWHQRKDGARLWGSGLMMRLDQPGGGYLKIFRDRTAEHEAEAAIRRHEARYRTLFEAIDVGFCILELKFDAEDRATDYRHVEVNPAFERLTGMAGIEGRWVSEAVPGLERHWFENYGRVALTGEPVRFEERAETLGRWYDVHAFRVGGPDEPRVAVLFNDVSERRRAEVALNRLNETLEAQVAERTAERDRTWQVSRDLLGVADEDGVWLSVNPAWTRTLGWKPQDVLGRTSEWLEHPDDRVKTRAEVGRLAEGQATLAFENRFRTRDGHYRDLSWTAAPVERRLYCVARDVTHEKELTAARRLYENIVQSDNSPVLAFDAAHRVIAFNKAHGKEFVRVFGLQQKVGDVLPDLFPTEQAEVLRGLMDRALAGETFTVVEEFGDPNLAKPYFEINYAPLRDEEGRIIGAFHHARDITARLRAEAELAQAQEALRQSQKMEAVGQLTGGIAHDFNNLLTGIVGSLNLLQRRAAEGRYDQLQRYTGVAIMSAQRAAALTQRLLAFSRRQPLDPKPVEANRLVAGMEDLLQRTLGTQIDLEFVLAGGLWPTLCDPNQLDSAILNLAINARDAMPEGGRLTVETANAHLDKAYARAHAGEVEPGQYVMVAVTDTGIGIPREQLTRIFEPFFTTKPIGQGTGLGLSQLYGFAKQSGGHVGVYSEEGRGTTFRLYLPRHRGKVAGAEAEPDEAGVPERAETGETVLVVDDEAAIRMVIGETLEELGYSALEAIDGPSGLKVLQSDQRIDLLVTDVGLPGLNGRQLADAARELRPELKVLFITGFAGNAAVGNGVLEHGMEILPKPFAMDQLAGKIREMMEGGERNSRG